MRFYLALTGDEEKGIETIPYYDAGGRKFDFHALGGQFGTGLARSGVSLAVARELMRHSTVELTAKHYTLFLQEDRRAAIEKLPDTKPKGNTDKGGKTGTED